MNTGRRGEPAVGVVTMIVLTALLIAVAWALALQGLTGQVRTVAVDALDRY